MKDIKIKDLIENHSLVHRDEIYESKKRLQQFTDIANIVNYDSTSSDEEKMRQIEYIIFNIQYRKEVLNKIER